MHKDAGNYHVVSTPKIKWPKTTCDHGVPIPALLTVDDEAMGPSKLSNSFLLDVLRVQKYLQET